MKQLCKFIITLSLSRVCHFIYISINFAFRVKVPQIGRRYLKMAEILLTWTLDFNSSSGFRSQG